MGASYCSSISGSVLLQSHGRPGFSVDAGEWLHYASSVWDDAALSILLTTSGESAELVELFKRGGNRALGLICNNPASTCWHLAKNKLPILAGPEYGNATKTYTNATAAAIILASEIVGRPWQQEAERAAEVFSAHLDPIFAMRGDLERILPGRGEYRNHRPRRGLRRRLHERALHPRNERPSRRSAHRRRLQARAQS
jgi:glucosamine--fructose-6-phosphate aminotransferase (isomerizing)